MKKVFNSLFVIIAAMVTFAGCAKQEIDAPATPETKTVQFFANSIETKTVFGEPDGKTYPTLWTANDQKVAVALNGTSKDAEVAAVAEDGKTASFETTFTDDESGVYQFFALSPASAKNNITATVISANIWSAQTPSVNSVDENAMVLYAVSDQYTEFPTSVPVNFKHFTAYGKLSFKNLNLNGAEVTSVSISSSAYIAGRWNYTVATKEYAVNSGNNTITLNTDATEDLWFACAPVGSMDGQTLKFTINTSNGPLSKEVTLTGDKYNFESGHIANIVVDMDGIEFAKSDIYTLVTDISQLTVGSKVIIAASDYDTAMSTTQNNNNRAEAGQSKKDNTIVDPADNVEILEVETGASTGTFALRATKYEGYIYAAGGTGKNNHLKTKEQKDNVSSWTITIAASGEATIKCAETTVARNTLKYNNSSKIFSCYASGQQPVSIYRLEGDNEGGSETPEPEPDPTPDPEPEPVDKQTIAEVIALNKDVAVNTEGLVVAKYERGILISDASGIILVYNGEAVDAQIGDQVAVSGKKGVYNGWAQIATPSVEVTSSGNNVTYPSVAELNGSGMDDLISATSVSYIQYTGILTISGTYYNVNVEGATTAIGSIQYPAASLGLSDMNGKKIKVTGYHVGISSGKYVNTMATSVEVVETEEEPETPAPVINILTASPIEVAANGGNGTISYAIENPTTATITATDDAEWLTLGVPTSTSVSYTVIENTGAERTATITLAYEGAEFKTVTVKQAAAEQGGGEEPEQPTTSTASIDFTKLYTSNTTLTDLSFDIGDATLTFGSTGKTKPQYYTNGAAVRFYGNNEMTISSSKKIVKIVFTFTTKPTSSNSSFTPGSFDYTTSTWTGETTSVLIKNTAASGNWRFSKIEVTYQD